MRIKKTLFFNTRIRKSISIFIKAHIISDRYVRILLHYLSFQVLFSVNISHYEDMYYLLLPSVPLAKFHMFSGHVWDQSRSRNFRSTINLLITQYTNTLGIS